MIALILLINIQEGMLSKGEVEAEMGKMEHSIMPGSKWQMIRGTKGDFKIGKSHVRFLDKQQVEVFWSVEDSAGNERYAKKAIYYYRLDPISHLPIIPSWSQTGRFRFVGERLVLEGNDNDPLGGSLELPGKLSLILK